MKPNKIRILGKTYSVAYTSGKPLAQDDLGHCDYGQQRIAVRSGLAHDEERSTLLHEAIHAVAYGMNTRLSEQKVGVLESGLYALLVDNPDLVAYLTKKKDARS
jgi:hypothetical protein